VEGARASRVGRAVSGKNKKLSKGATTRVTSTRADTDTIVDDLTNALAVATKAVQNTERTVSLVQRYESFANQLHKRYEEIAGDYQRYFRNYLAASFVYIFVGY
jgi:chemotaxis regulatin CheY-phosphate phosphatase CheZ